MREMKTCRIPFCEHIPSGWTEIPNKYIFHCYSKKVGDKSSEYQLLSLTTSGVKEKSTTASGGKVPASYDGYQTVTKGDMIFCLFDLDCSAVFSGLSPFDGMITSAYDVLRANPQIADNHFLEYWFQYVFSNRYYKMFSKNIRYTITGEMFNSLFTPIPPVEEQKKIGKYLDELCYKVDALIANQEAQIEKLKAYKQALITEVVTKGLNPDPPMKDSGVEWIGKIPESWSISKVRYIGTLQNGISKGGEFFGEGYPFVSYGDIYKNYVLPENVTGLVKSSPEEQDTYSVKKGDIFFTRTSETIDEVGFSCVCDKTIDHAVFAGFVIRLRPYEVDHIILTNYAKYYFRGSQIRKYLVKEMNLVTRASLGQTLLKGMSVTVPPKSVQQEIADYLDVQCARIDYLISIKQRKIERLNQYKKSLIYEYVTGKKEVI